MIIVDGKYMETSVIEATSSYTFKTMLDQEILRLTNKRLAVQIEIHAPVGCIGKNGTEGYMFSATLVATSSHPSFG